MSGNVPWQHRYVEANGIRLHYVEAGEGFPVVLLHGFPELWYSWRHQIPALAAAGLRAIAPDLRGYGESDKPPRIEDYDIQHLVGDVVGLLDALGLEKAVLVGHDWGSIILWMVTVMHPDRVERVVSLNVPYRGRPGFPPVARLRQAVESGGSQFNYVLTFQEPGHAEAIFAQDLPGRLRRLYEGAAGRPDFLSDEDFQVYLRAFQQGGLTGPLNYYRNIDRNWELTDHLHERQVTCQAMLVMTDRDPVLRPEMAQGMERWVPNLRLEMVRDCGHWTQQERPEEVNRLLLDFLGDLARR
ncbi:MAG: alpha/beta fold hydrolase [Dehalococcoidia bacterium]|jgi:pimeloyl-ACP methyl ester carboxylesterase|nr:alpha/beta fold hydrolase [Dehalococcoidia bacterium]MDW8008198.1 alpha/beta fold hydrolase [Chloroflexota bacterium]